MTAAGGRAGLVQRFGRLPADFVRGTVAGLADRDTFGSVERYCMFIGYPRSGHSLVGSLVDAHPDAVIAHELDVLRYLQAGFRRTQIYALILRNERQFTEAGRRARTGGYEYNVEGQWQGRFRTLRVIGDKRGGRSSFRLGQRPELLDRLRRVVGVPLRVVHGVRNPYDNIATMSLRSRDRSLAASADRYFSLCSTVAATRARLAPDELIDVRHEDLVAAPAAALERLSQFLGLAPEPEYIAASAAIVRESPHRSREKVEWTDGLVESVAGRMADFPHLAGYDFAH